MFSYWEQQSFFHYDILVIGCGIVGLSAAVSLKEKNPSLNLAILERGIIPAGASTRNAGFACIGSFTEMLDDLENMPEDRVLSLIKMRRDGLTFLRKRLGDKQIGYNENGSYELINKESLVLLDQLEAINQKIKPLFSGNIFSVKNKKIDSFGFNNNEVKALVKNHFEGELNTGRMMYALMQKAITMGVEIKTGCDVVSLEEKPGEVEVVINGKTKDFPVIFHADKIVVCTNAFTKTLLPDVDLQPGRGQVLITEPVADLPFKGIFHFDRGYYYFREINKRVLFGGGRNLDFKREATTETVLNKMIQKDLEEKLKTIILPRTKIKIANRWAGIMAFGKDKYPLIEQHADRIFIGVRLGGMGIAIGSEVGRMLAEMMQKG